MCLGDVGGISADTATDVTTNKQPTTPERGHPRNGPPKALCQGWCSGGKVQVIDLVHQTLQTVGRQVAWVHLESRLFSRTTQSRGSSAKMGKGGFGIRPQVSG